MTQLMDRQDRRQRRLGYGNPYPNGRPQNFSRKYIRLLLKSCVPMEVEPSGMNLLTLIASLEDSKNYSGAVLYTDVQMLPILGIDPEALVRVRRKCVDQGWLHYEPGWKGTPSRYWVQVPVNQKLAGDLYDEDDEIHSGFPSESPSKRPSESPSKRPSESPSKRPSESPSTVLPYPIPYPPPSPEWGEAEAALRKLGMGSWKRAIDHCRRHGLQPGDVQQLLSWWEAHRSEFQQPVGALYFALSNAGPEHREAWGNTFPRPPEGPQRPLEALQASQAVQAAVDCSRAQEQRLRQLEFDWEAQVKGLTIPEICDRFQPPPELQARLAPYRTWEATSRALGLRIEVLTLVKTRLAP